MRLLTGIFIVFCALACGAQTATPTAAPAEDEEESGQTTKAAPAAAAVAEPAPPRPAIGVKQTDNEEDSEDD